jgi:hypothetical protein
MGAKAVFVASLAIPYNNSSYGVRHGEASVVKVLPFMDM